MSVFTPEFTAYINKLNSLEEVNNEFRQEAIDLAGVASRQLGVVVHFNPEVLEFFQSVPCPFKRVTAINGEMELTNAAITHEDMKNDGELTVEHCGRWFDIKMFKGKLGIRCVRVL